MIDGIPLWYFVFIVLALLALGFIVLAWRIDETGY